VDRVDVKMSNDKMDVTTIKAIVIENLIDEYIRFSFVLLIAEYLLLSLTSLYNTDLEIEFSNLIAIHSFLYTLLY
jgi:hypothetical protein